MGEASDQCSPSSDWPAQALVYDCSHPQRMRVYEAEAAYEDSPSCRGQRVEIDAARAMRDPLFWLDMIISRVSFGLINIGRWKRYVTLRDDDPQQVG